MMKHLTLEERGYIEKRLNGRESLKKIAAALGRHPSTIAREIQSHLTVRRTGAFGGGPFNNCAHKYDCTRQFVCSKEDCKRTYCRHCRFCISACPDFEKKECLKLASAPYVCNGCQEKKKCTLEKREYSARYAQTESDQVLRESRGGVRLTDAELRYIDELVSPRIRQGQSPYAVIAGLREQLPVSERTLYRLINGGYLGADRMDLPEAVQRKTKQPLRERNYKVDRDCLNGRKYEDFCDLRDSSINFPLVEMDTVYGSVGTSCLLTLHFTEAHFMGAVLLDHRSAYDIRKAFEDLYTKLGPEAFRRAFPVILTDNGGEFSDPARLEKADDESTPRTRIFCCHPYSSYEKPHCESNHRMPRRLFPKRMNVNFGDYSQEEISEVMSHVNSYPRRAIQGQTPYELLCSMLPDGAAIAQVFGIHSVASEDVVMKSSLLPVMLSSLNTTED